MDLSCSLVLFALGYAALAGVLSLDALAFLQSMVSQPLPVCVLLGLAAGHGAWVTGLLVGLALQLLFATDVPVGAHLPSDASLLAMGALGAAIVAGMGVPETGLAVLLALAVDSLVVATAVWARRINGRWTPLVRRLLESGQDGRALLAAQGGLLVFFLRAFLVVLLMTLGGGLLVRLGRHLPEAVLRAVGTALFIMPMLGVGRYLGRYGRELLGLAPARTCPPGGDFPEAGRPPSAQATGPWGIFLRSFLIQASWSYRGMQNLGMATMTVPELRRLGGPAESTTVETAGQTTFFNTHPYLAGGVAGAIVELKSRGKSGRGFAVDADRLKESLMGPLGCVGDALFWEGLLPLAGVAGLLMAFAGWPLRGVALFLVLYNVAHLAVRWSAVRAGLGGTEVFAAWFSRFDFQRRARLLRVLAAAGCVLAPFAWGWWPLNPLRHDGVWVAVVVGASVAAATAWLTRRGVGVWALVGGTLLLGLLLTGVTGP